MPYNSFFRRTQASRAALAFFGLTTVSALLPYSAQAAPPAKLTVSFQNTDAADVLRAIAIQSGMSIAVTPSVKGKIISVRLKEVTSLEALQIVSETAGLAYRRNGNTYVIGTEEELKKIRAVGISQTYTLQHMNQAAARTLLEVTAPYVSVAPMTDNKQVTVTGPEAEVRQAVRQLEQSDVPLSPVSQVLTPKYITPVFFIGVARKLAPAGTNLEAQGNIVLVTGSPAAVVQVRELLLSLDTAEGAPQRVEVYRVRYSSSDALVTMLRGTVQGLSAAATAEPYAPPAAQFNPISGNAVATGALGTTGGGTSGNGTSVNGTAAGLGIGGAASTAGAIGANGTAIAAPAGPKSRQIILSGSDSAVTQALRLLREVDVAPAQVEIIARIVDVSRTNDFDLGIQWGGLAPDGTFTQGNALNPIGEASATGVIQFGKFVRSPLSLAAQLKFLETQSRAKTLANPHISAIDNEDASVFIGDIRRFQILAASSATAGNAFTVVEIPVGVTLLVRPRVNDNGDITLRVHPAVSSLTGFVADLPQTSTREAETTMRVRDGETIAIGGLLRDDEIKSLEQVPLLGRVPLFGELFRRRKNTKVKSEVILFLTAHVLPDPDKAPATASATPAIPVVPATPDAPAAPTAPAVSTTIVKEPSN